MINVIGLGYIGLPTALMLAANGVEVRGTDLSNELVEKLCSGEVTFDEPGLRELYESAVSKDIAFSTQYFPAEMYIVVKAVESVLEVCPKGAVIVIESTISPGTVDRFVRPAVERCGLRCGEDVHLAHAPERIIPGNMIYELRHNSRTIGADSPETARKVRDVYSSFCLGELVLTDIRTAEMTKVVENTYRDINIAFANELAKICRSDGMDVYEIIRIANKHPRVNILSPGPGVGGHCISVDPWFLVGDYPMLAKMILCARQTNDSMPEFVLGRIREVMAEEGLTDVSRVGFYGLTYKENVDDVRESPTLQMLEHMDSHLAGGRVKVYDPWVKRDLVPNQYHDFDAFLNDVDMVVILVGHSELREQMDKLEGKVVLDTRHVCFLPGTHRL